MREEGIIRSVSGKLCSVEVTRKSACGENCASCGGNCKLKTQICIAENICRGVPGDRVIIEISDKKMLKSAFLVYILPILVFFVVYVASSACSASDSISAIAAVLCFAIVLSVLTFYDKRHTEEFESKAIEII